MLGEALLERATSPAEIVRGARAVFARPRRVARAALDAAEAAGAFARAGFAAPSSPFNVAIGPYRRFAWVSAELGETQAHQERRRRDGQRRRPRRGRAGRSGATCASTGHSTHGLELRAMVPISVRAADEHGALGNRVSSYMAPLPVWCEDPLERLRPGQRDDGRPQTVQAGGRRDADDRARRLRPADDRRARRRGCSPRQRFFNLVVTNVPGPQFPLYLLGRRLEAIYPMVPLAKRQAVCFGIMSYNGQVNFGLIGDYDAFGDLEALADDLGPRSPSWRRSRRRSRRKSAASGAQRPPERHAPDPALGPARGRPELEQQREILLPTGVIGRPGRRVGVTRMGEPLDQ